MSKAALLAELSNNTYVMLQPSPIAGIGVFAIQDIPKNCRDMFSKPDVNDKWITVSKQEVDALPAHAQFIVGNYCLYDNENYFIPDHGFKKIDLSLFLNHSDTPNIISINDGDYFETTRDIKAGEELLLDYGEIVDGE
jgi:SET domain-containing protein